MSRSAKLSLIEHVSSKEKKQRYVNRLFETIADRYDFFTALMSYGMDRGWKRTLLEMAALSGSERVLDIACGTGDITFEAGRRLNNGCAIGLDITQSMLAIAQRKKQKKHENVVFHRADIMRLPFSDETFDCVTGGYALRNVPDIPGALEEIKRVLKSGGRVLALDFGHPSNRIYRWAYLKYLIIVGSALGIIMHRDADTYRYIPETLRRYPGQGGVAQLMIQAGFENTGFKEFGGGIMAINYGSKPLN